MKLFDGCLLYHGSYQPVEHIDLSRCANGKDFGQGFYLTSDPRQARLFIRTSLFKAKVNGLLENPSQTWGYVSTFVFRGNPDDFKYYEFPTADAEWLRFVIWNRLQGKSPLPKSFLRRKIAAEIIAGKVANDNTNPVLNSYVQGLYGPLGQRRTIDIVISLLMPERLKDQFCFLTQNAANSLVFKEIKKYEIR